MAESGGEEIGEGETWMHQVMQYPLTTTKRLTLTTRTSHQCIGYNEAEGKFESNLMKRRKKGGGGQFKNVVKRQDYTHEGE
jgi:hypothetical protein